MRNFLTAAAVAAVLVAAVPGRLSAEGYQVNTLSARQNGMGHTGTALKLGAESNIFNPAGLAFMNGTIDLSGSVTGIFASASAKVDGLEYKTANDPSTPMSFNLGMKVYDNFKVGLSFYTPYGSGINWGENWPGAVLNQSVSLKAFTLQPTLAWRILPNLSVGAGVMVTWGSVDLNKGLVTPSSLNAMLGALQLPVRFEDTPASINLSGRAAVAVGVNAGVMWDISDKVTVGASFRSKMMMKVKCGDASVVYANETARNLLQQQLNILNQANFKAEMPCAAVYNFGVSYKPVPKLILAFDAQLTGWKAYKSLEIDFLSEQLKPYNQHLEKNYRNSWTFHLGGQYSFTSRLDLRAGLMIDTTPVSKQHYNPETPGMTKIEPSVGFSFFPIKNFSIDGSLLYVAGLGADGASCSYADLLAGKTATFTADYKVHAWNPSIGVSFHF